MNPLQRVSAVASRRRRQISATDSHRRAFIVAFNTSTACDVICDVYVTSTEASWRGTCAV